MASNPQFVMLQEEGRDYPVILSISKIVSIKPSNVEGVVIIKLDDGILLK